jgi:hypothetical protein
MVKKNFNMEWVKGTQAKWEGSVQLAASLG